MLYTMDPSLFYQIYFNILEESFVRGDPILTTFFFFFVFYKGMAEVQYNTRTSRSGSLFKWRFVSPTLNAGLVSL